MTQPCVTGRRSGDVETLQSETTTWAHDASVQQRSVDRQMRDDDDRCKPNNVYPELHPLQS
ncbi:hypothetical protein [Novipirellula galeiformis]|uniref:hypothetical protein n=1 Tax=Novipirellula galeiformis TaxID=2528004 RepID=UPI0011B418AB|nr:hypothetical protein [Novipirellula galeiformis]